MTPNFMVEAIGFTAGILGLIAWIPQIIRVWYKGEHEGISLLTLASILATLALWVVYGFLIEMYGQGTLRPLGFFLGLKFFLL